MDIPKRSRAAQISKSYDNPATSMQRSSGSKPKVMIPGIVQGPSSRDTRYYANGCRVQDGDRLPRLYPRPEAPLPTPPATVAAYLGVPNNYCSGDASVIRGHENLNIRSYGGDRNEQRFQIGPAPMEVRQNAQFLSPDRVARPYLENRNNQPFRPDMARFDITAPPAVLPRYNAPCRDVRYQDLPPPEVTACNAFPVNDSGILNDRISLEEAVRLKRQQMAEATKGLHVSPAPCIIAQEEQRRISEMRKQEELRQQMESNPHLARRERMKMKIEERKSHALIRLQERAAENERLAVESEKTAEEERKLEERAKHRLDVLARERSLDKRQLRGQARDRAREYREKQRLQEEQKVLENEAKRRAACEERLRVAEAARINALEEARRKADEMELKQQNNAVQQHDSKINELNHGGVDVRKINSKFLKDDREEMQILEAQLRRDQEIVEQAERLQRATLTESNLRHRISEEEMKKHRAEVRANKSKSVPSLSQKRDPVKPKARPIWGVTQSRMEYKKMSERDPNYLRRQQQKNEVKKKVTTPGLSREVTFTIAEREPDPLQTGVPFALTFKPNPNPRRIVMVHKSTSPRNPRPVTRVVQVQGHAQEIYVDDDEGIGTWTRDSPYMSITERITDLRSNCTPNAYRPYQELPILYQHAPQAFSQDTIGYSSSTVSSQCQYEIQNAPARMPCQDYSLPRRPATTENEVSERDDLIRYLLNRRRLRESTNNCTLDEPEVPMIYYAIQLPSKYARISRSLGFRAIAMSAHNNSYFYDL